MSRAFYYIALLALVASCTRYVTDPLPPGAIQFTPPPSWQRYADSMARCSGRAFSGEIDWWLVEDGTLGQQITARWDYPHRIAITRWYYATENGTTIMHEMLHDLLGTDNLPEPQHPPVFDRCGVNP